MTEAERAELAALLERSEETLERSIAGLRESIASPAGGAGPEVRDAVEDGDDRMMSTLDLEHLRRQEHELREIRGARDRMRQGSYGRCEACDEPIPVARLRVLPTARLCVRDEERLEQAQAAS
jgi:DnaK suppressor protein